MHSKTTVPFWGGVAGGWALRSFRAVLVALWVLGAGSSCDSSGTYQSSGDAGTEPTSSCLGAGPALAGFIRDPKGEAVASVEVEAGGVSTAATEQGAFCLAGLSPGATTVTVQSSWFQDKTQQVLVSGEDVTRLDLVITPWPLKITAADRSRATQYAVDFDWSRDMVSVVLVEGATRSKLDNAIYYQNPALYQDTSLQDPLVPAPQPTLGAAGPSGFSFPISAGAGAGQEALDLSSLVDNIAGTELEAAEQADFMMWTPMCAWLFDKDVQAAAGLSYAWAAVRGQRWGGEAIHPQEIEMAFLQGQEIWVKVVFEPFVQLGPGITDSDQDGRKEVYAKINKGLYTAEILNTLRSGYLLPTYDTHSLSRQLGSVLNALYTTTAAKVESTIGQAFDLPGLGTIEYPFMVLRHSKGHRNVILVAP